MRRNIKGLAVAIGLVLISTTGAGASDLGEIQIHGFLSQGYLDSTDYDVFTADSQGGTFALNEMGINFSIEPVENLRIGVQLYARDLGEMGNHEIELDWAVGDYRWRDELGFRLGKVKMPFGLYNEVRDADMARPSILLPQGIYPETLRDLINAYMGGEIYGSFDIGNAGVVGYRAFMGTMDIDDTYIVERFMERGAAIGLNNLPFPLEHGTYALSNLDASMDHIYGGMVEWATPIDGLRVQGTWHTSESNFSANTTYSGWMGEFPASITIHTDTTHETASSWVISAEYAAGNLLLAGEYWEGSTVVANTLSGLPFPLPQMPAIKSTNLAYYGQAAYRLNDWFQMSAYYSQYFPDKNDKDGDGLVARGRSAHEGWSKDLTLTARFDLSRSWLFKLEAHLIDGTAIVEELDNPVISEKDWSIFLARFTYHF